MTRSLRLRWTLALVAVCLVEAALVAAAVRVTTVRAFEQFVIEEAFESFVTDAQEFARGTGSIEAFQPRERQRPLAQRPPAQRPPRQGLAGQGPPDQARPETQRRRPGAGPRGQRPRPGDLAQGVTFGLADSSGRVILSFDDYERGAMLDAGTLARGEAIEVEGRTVGTAFVPADAADALPAFPPTSPEARFIRASSTALLWALAGALALAVGLGFWLTSRTVRPLRHLTDAAGRIASGELRQRVAVETEDEVGQLAAAFNAMSERLAEATALRKQMTADISHDLRTPLTAVLGILEATAAGALPATPERLATAHAEAERLRRMIDDLHTLALADAGELSVYPSPFEAADALHHVARSFEAEASGAGVALSVTVPEALTLVADPDRVTQILGNLVGNALRHTPPGGQITLAAGAAGDTVALRVIDTGEGIPPETLPTVFERATRADASRSGTGSGLGLSIVRSLAEAMGGSAEIESAHGMGTTVTVRLPSASSAL